MWLEPLCVTPEHLAPFYTLPKKILKKRLTYRLRIVFIRKTTEAGFMASVGRRPSPRKRAFFLPIRKCARSLPRG